MKPIFSMIAKRFFRLVERREPHTHTHSLKFAYRTSKIWKVTEQNHQDYASLLYAYKKGVVTEMLKQVCPGQNICPMFRFIDRTPFGAFVLPYFTLMPISLPKFSPNNDQTITGRVVPFDAFVCLFLHTPIVANYQQKKHLTRFVPNNERMNFIFQLRFVRKACW